MTTITTAPGQRIYTDCIADDGRRTYLYRGHTIAPDGPGAYAYRAHRSDMWRPADDAQAAVLAIDEELDGPYVATSSGEGPAE
jgi:hypothetical protein